ncbi:MAG: hydantoinase/carbamoylase family amidase, partial [Rhodospirillaceae bacterium]|nr:hydantoinase/carbamoylase family amidase [Rhodospirillaceae bacterium]
ENEEKTIGVVTGAQGQHWDEITVPGQEAHAGPTPMPLRKDALVATARMIDAINRLGHAFPPYACATVGFVDASPNSRNTIPGKVFFTVDLRHPDDDTLAAMNDRLRAEFAEIAEAAGCTVDIVDFWQFPAQPFDEDCVSAVRAAAEQGGHAWRDIVSGAGHDAVYIARIAPTGMIFIPCEDGISHNEIENATPEDCAAGAEVLLKAVLDRAVE